MYYKNKNIHKNMGIKRVLFPVKVLQSTTIGEKPSPLSDYHEKSLIGGKEFQKQDMISWQGLTPIEIMENIAFISEVRGSSQNKKSNQSYRIETSYLATKTPDIPPFLLGTSKSIDSNLRSKNGDSLIQSRSTQLIKAYDLKKKYTNKRRRSSCDTDGNHYQEETSNESLSDYLSPWDPSTNTNVDPHSCNPDGSGEKLKTLVFQFESMPNFDDFAPSYRRLHEETFEQYHYAMTFFSESHLMKKKYLGFLYEQTYLKLETLFQMASKNLRIANISVQSSAESNTSKKASNSNSMRRKKKDTSNKKDFTEFMNNWLRENWTNPYPDDDGLNQIAASCGTSSAVVSNWLINARTRKWRPAIVKAYGGGRPAELLKEDAINIFDGKPVRTLSDPN